jgi:RHS repeat-associated protein
VTEQTFNPRGGVASSTEAYYGSDGPQRTTSFQYDTQDRQTKTMLPDQNEINTSYGAASQTVTDPNGKATTTRFDAYGRVVAVERMFNGSLATTTTTYDTPLGLLRTMTDAVNSPWTWRYDSLGRQYDEVDPDAGHWVYEYDDAGRPTKQTDAKNQVTNMTYNTGGRLATKVTPVGTTTYTYSEPRTGYLNVGRLTTVTSPADTLKIDYDKLGRAAQQQRIFGGTTYTVTKTWDVGGYLQSTKYPDNDTIGSLGYDEAGRLKTIPNIINDITYDAAGRPTTRSNTNSTTTTWAYSADRGFLNNIYTQGPSGALQGLSYTYDAAGLVQSVTSPSPNEAEGWTYAYDDFYHLTSATNASSSADTQTFTYDKVDRITSNSRTGVVLNYTYPANGSATRPHAPTAVNGAGRTYDANGNLTLASGQTLTWNGENRLSTAVVGSTTTTFTYDSFGERLKKASGSNTSIYPFGDDYEVTNGTITKYISVDGLGLVAKKSGATTYWIQTDRLGSINVETDSTGSLPPALRRSYRPFGETLTSTGSLAESRGWIDQRNDTETTFTYLHARYFDPKLGQFLSPDPIGIDGGVNEFAYGSGDPVNGSDRSGLYWCGPPDDPTGRWCEEVDADPGKGGKEVPKGSPGDGNKRPESPEERRDRRRNEVLKKPVPKKPPVIIIRVPPKVPPTAPCKPAASLDNSNLRAVPFTDDAGNVQFDLNRVAIQRPDGWDPHFFTGAGARIGLSPLAFQALATKFHQGGPWDAQRAGILPGGRPTRSEFKSGSNVFIGLFAAAAGIPETVTLSITNDYAAVKSGFIEPLDPDYTFLPARLVNNIQMGYDLQQTGAVCTP